MYFIKIIILAIVVEVFSCFGFESSENKKSNVSAPNQIESISVSDTITATPSNTVFDNRTHLSSIKSDEINPSQV